MDGTYVGILQIPQVTSTLVADVGLLPMVIIFFFLLGDAAMCLGITGVAIFNAISIIKRERGYIYIFFLRIRLVRIPKGG